MLDGPPVGTVIGARYGLCSVLGQGGWGVVYEAEDQERGQRVALKLLRMRCQGEGTALKRFRREIETGTAVRHPNLVTFLDHGEHDGQPYLTMEILEGVSLHSLIERGALSLSLVHDVSLQLLGALRACHDAGILHRDLKPDNVMVLKGGTVKLLDFGIARFVEEVLKDPEINVVTRDGSVIGTPQYFSPEQVRGHRLDARSDLYSFGCLLFEMVTGRPPFVGKNLVYVAHSHVREAPPRASDLADVNVPGWLDDLIDHLLAKSPEDRPAGAAEVLAVLEEHELADTRPGPLERIASFFGYSG